MSELGRMMFHGMMDDHAFDRVRRHANDAARSSVEWREEAVRLAAELELAEGWTAGNLALRYALQSVLAQYMPDHPLLADAALRDRLVEAGKTALKIANNWDAAREAGRTFALPEYTFEWTPNQRVRQLVEERRAAQADLDRTKAALAAAHALLTKLQQNEAKLIRDCAHHMAQSAAFREHLAALDAEHPLIADRQLRQRVAELGYQALMTTKSWDAVREVGATILDRDTERSKARERVALQFASEGGVCGGEQDAPQDSPATVREAGG